MRRHVLLLILFAIATLLSACGQSARIEGQVKDAFGQPLEGVLVKIEKSAFSTTTDASGKYHLEYAPGEFIVTYTKGGFTSEEVKLNISQNAKFPAEVQTLYPMPSEKGVYLLDTKSGRLIKGSTNLSKIYLEEKSAGFMEVRQRYFINGQDKKFGSTEERIPIIVDFDNSVKLVVNTNSKQVALITIGATMIFDHKIGPLGQVINASAINPAIIQKVGREELAVLSVPDLNMELPCFFVVELQRVSLNNYLVPVKNSTPHYFCSSKRVADYRAKKERKNKGIQ